MVVDAKRAGDAERTAKIFISYSRADMAFADRLETALTARGFEPLIDRTEIYAFEDWWERIKNLIGSADTIVFVLSPDSVASEVCTKEVAYATSLNKRFAPIVCRRVEDSAVPEALRRLNFIFFSEPASFEVKADRLAEALETDIEWIRRHTQFGEFALRWHAAGRPGPGGLMLRPPLLTDAEAWLGLRPRNAPEPTELIGSFISVSRETFDQEQAAIAASQINLLARVAESELLRGHFATSLRLCVHAAQRSLDTQRKMPTPLLAHSILAAEVCRTPWHLMLTGHESPVTSARFDHEARASSQPPRIEPHASGAPHPGGISRCCEAMTARSNRPPLVQRVHALLPRQRARLRAYGMPQPAVRLWRCAGTKGG
jgi:TIR domain